MTRWRSPPESWCGNWPSRISGAVMPTRPISSTARSSAAAREAPLWRVSTSAICEPTVKAGLRLVIGSWKIIDMRLPRMRAIVAIRQRQKIGAGEAHALAPSDGRRARAGP